MLFAHPLSQSRVLSLFLACTAGMFAWKAETQPESATPSVFAAVEIEDVPVQTLLESTTPRSEVDLLGDESYVWHVGQKFLGIKMAFFSNVLELTPGQQRQLEILTDKANEQISLLRAKLEPLSLAEQSRGFVNGGLPLAKEADDQLANILTPEQFAKLNQLAWGRQSGAVALLHPELVRRLELSSDQQSELCRIINETRAQLEQYEGNVFMVFQIRKAGLAARQRAEELLNPRQAQLWKELREVH